MSQRRAQDSTEQTGHSEVGGDTGRVGLGSGAPPSTRDAMTPPLPEGGRFDGLHLEGARILVVDDESAVRRAVAKLLMPQGAEVLTAEDGASALSLLATTKVDVLLVDLAMPVMDGMAVLARVKRQHPDVEVIVLTGYGQLDAGVLAIRAGAYDFLAKPLPGPEVVVVSVSKAVERRRLFERASLLERRLEQHERFGELVGSSSAMQEVYRVALGVAPTDTPVLITGESGTGKGLLARAIHQHGARAERPLRMVACAAIPTELLGQELFGDGAARPGLFQQASGGTLVLEDVGALSLDIQAKLAAMLERGAVGAGPGGQESPLNVRLVATSRTDLKPLVDRGEFRDDLYYRLAVVPIHIPPLRTRREDVPLLAYSLLQKHARKLGKELRRISVEALRDLREHPWPGNVRELDGAIEHAALMARSDAILPGDLPRDKSSAGSEEEGEARLVVDSTVVMSQVYATAKDAVVEQFDRLYVQTLMARAGGNVSEAARQAGMDRSNFRRLLKKVRARSPGARQSKNST
jgi:DNA-binding NtrC family response regulator